MKEKRKKKNYECRENAKKPLFSASNNKNTYRCCDNLFDNKRLSTGYANFY